MQFVYDIPSDTPDYIRKKQNEIVLSKPPLERLKMCIEMSNFSFDMLKRVIKSKNPGISPNQLKFEMVKAMYADCYSEEEMARIEEHFLAF